MAVDTKAWLIGGGIGSLAAAAFMIRDGGMPGSHITILESAPSMGGALDAHGTPATGYCLPGGRMLTADNYECTWDLFRSIPSLDHEGQSVHDETLAFNTQHQAHSMARLVDARRAKVPVASMGFTMHDRAELLKLSLADEAKLGDSCITDWLSPAFFETEFWAMWVTTFAFQPWHSAAELRRYLHRFVLEFTRIETLGGVKRTVYNQYDSLVAPLLTWLRAHGVNLVNDCVVTDLDSIEDARGYTVTGLHGRRDGEHFEIEIGNDDQVYFQNASMTDAMSIGSMHRAPSKRDRGDSGGWVLWESLAAGRPQFGRPAAFNRSIAETCWESFTVTLDDPAFFARMEQFTGNVAGTGGLVTFRDSNWLMSIVLAHQPHFINQPLDVQVFWGYGLKPDRIGNFVAKAMADCTGAEILQELSGHLRFDSALLAHGNCIPCRMPYITSMFMPRRPGDRPLPVPAGSRNLSLISQFVELAEDCVFTVEYSVRAAQTAVYQRMGITRTIPAVTPHDHSLQVQFEAVLKAFR